MCQDGERRYTRALYGGYTEYRVETSDRPIFGIFRSRAHRHVRFALTAGGVTTPLEATTHGEARYNAGKRVYLLGSKPGIAELAAEKLKARHPGLQIVGTADGYFKDEGPVVEKINAAAPDILFVCLGAPKQEKFMKNHQQELQVRFMIGLGGSLDGFAGTVKRAPVWMQKANLEWFYRLVKEPRRLGRMMRLPKFILAVKKEARKG